MVLLFSQHSFRLQYYVAVNQMNNLSCLGPMSICRAHQMIHFLIYISRNRNNSQTNRALRNCIKWHGTKPKLSPIIEWNGTEELYS